MASKTREHRIIHAVACPECGAPIGQMCRVNQKSYDPAGLGGKHRPILHTARRKAWQAKHRE